MKDPINNKFFAWLAVFFAVLVWSGIGDVAITTTPNETYALTGLKLKAKSPLPKTMVIELANGADGYIPPPEQQPAAESVALRREGV